MNLPNLSAPVGRYSQVLSSQNRINPSSCTGIPTTQIGTCFGSNGPIPGNFNCQACCALRGAISWQGGGHAVAC